MGAPARCIAFGARRIVSATEPETRATLVGSITAATSAGRAVIGPRLGAHHPAEAPSGATLMPDNPSKKAPEDWSHISITEQDQAQYWADKFGVSKERLLEAVKKVGYSPYFSVGKRPKDIPAH